MLGHRCHLLVEGHPGLANATTRACCSSTVSHSSTALNNYCPPEVALRRYRDISSTTVGSQRHTQAGVTMTQTQESADMINEALALIDRGLTDISHRALVSSDEVANLLLDVRTVLHADLDVELQDAGSPN